MNAYEARTIINDICLGKEGRKIVLKFLERGAMQSARVM